MTEYMRVDAMRDRWLDPPAYDEYRPRRRCAFCGDRATDIPYFRVKTGIVCDACRLGSFLPYDKFPEEKKAGHTCYMCGGDCEEAVTIIGDYAYCNDCIKEAQVDDYED